MIPWTWKIIWVSFCCLSAACGPPGRRAELRDAARYPEEIVTHEERRQEVAEKVRRVVDLARSAGLSGILLSRPDNFAWITGGGADAMPLGAQPAGAIFVRVDGQKFFLGVTGEVGRVAASEMESLGYTGRLFPWFDQGPSPPTASLRELSGGRVFGSDTARDGVPVLAEEVSGLRVPLTRWEVRKLRWLGRKSAETVDKVCRGIRPWMTDRGIEAEVSGLLAAGAIRTVEVRVQADCPVPGSVVRKVEKHAVVNLAASRWGLVVALARAVHFGPVSTEMKARYDALALVHAGYWARTVPGMSAAEIFREAVADYAAAGHPDAWKNGPQGGRIGYERWEWLAAAASDHRIHENQAFAWRPSIQDAVAEDTILLEGERLTVLTEMPQWPVVEQRALGRIYRMPGLLVVDPLRLPER